MTGSRRSALDVEAATPTTAPESAAAGRQRVVIEHVQPQIDGGRFAIKRTPGEAIVVTADMFADGHDLLAGVLLYRRVDAGPQGSGLPVEASGLDLSTSPQWAKDSGPDLHSPASSWIELPLTPGANDEWTASFTVDDIGTYEYTVEGWIDRFGSWLKGLVAKAEAGQDVASDLLEGADLVQRASSDSRHVGNEPRPVPDDDRWLLEVAKVLRSDVPQLERVGAARDPHLRALMDARPDRTASTRYDRTLRVTCDPERARAGAWYEMFPRSCTPDPSRGATLREAETRLPDIAAMGFDVLYLPPIHPIGQSFRKGRNNSLTMEAGDPGSPWAIGAADGGHTAIEPGLGTLGDFDRFVATAHRCGLQVALDIAFQASPDHPWVREHPEWFKHRPDGSIKYAENPPKKYQDIYPLDFESSAWPSLWDELKQVFLFWAGHGVTIFRVDNPHTKPFRFWEWCIADVKRAYPEAIFLAEAFTRPKVMRYLAKVGFTQSYTYFTWRNSAHELREYLTELTTTDVREYMRPNFFANTPDILHEYLQHGGRPAFEVRLVLAATLGASYGIYSGFELCENVAVRPGSEEYLDSEKYQIKVRDWNQPGNLNELIARVNEIRRRYRALQFNDGLQFHHTDNPALLFFSKTVPEGWREVRAGEAQRTSAASPQPPAAGRQPSAVSHEPLFVVANTDPHHMQHGWVELPSFARRAPAGKAQTADGATTETPGPEEYIVEDLLDGARYTWRGAWNYVRLDPAERMAHVFVIKKLTN